MNRSRPHEAPMPDPLAYFLTWVTYGTWLPGNERGWIEYRPGWQPADEARRNYAAARMTEDACILTQQQRALIEKTVREHCDIRGWELFAVSCRSNHIHVVVGGDLAPKQIRSQLKAWCTRRLKEPQLALGVPVEKVHENWWAERGSERFLNDDNSLEAAVRYALEAQDTRCAVDKRRMNPLKLTRSASEAFAASSTLPSLAPRLRFGLVWVGEFTRRRFGLPLVPHRSNNPLANAEHVVTPQTESLFSG